MKELLSIISPAYNLIPSLTEEEGAGQTCPSLSHSHAFGGKRGVCEKRRRIRRRKAIWGSKEEEVENWYHSGRNSLLYLPSPFPLPMYCLRLHGSRLSAVAAVRRSGKDGQPKLWRNQGGFEKAFFIATFDAFIGEIRVQAGEISLAMVRFA